MVPIDRKFKITWFWMYSYTPNVSRYDTLTVTYYVYCLLHLCARDPNKTQYLLSICSFSIKTSIRLFSSTCTTQLQINILTRNHTQKHTNIEWIILRLVSIRAELILMIVYQNSDSNVIASILGLYNCN